MSSYSETKGQLVINLLDSAVFEDLSNNNRLNLNELYLVQGQDTDEVLEVKYMPSGSKFVYTTVEGRQVDIVTLEGLKTLLAYATVASTGQYADLTGKPSINGVTLSGNKSTSDLGITIDYTSDSLTNKPKINGVTLSGNIASNLLGISYNDLSDLPSIPAVSSTYVPGNTGAALTSKGVEGALENYAPKARTITGTGALGGGGDLSANRTITHNAAPTGLSTAAIKVGVDNYGHVCTGPAITAQDVAAVPLKPTVSTSISALDGSSSAILVLASQSDTLGFTAAPESGKNLLVEVVNTTGAAIDITIPSSAANNLFVNNTRVTSNYVVSIPAGESREMEIIGFQNSGTSYAFIKVS